MGQEICSVEGRPKIHKMSKRQRIMVISDLHLGAWFSHSHPLKIQELLEKKFRRYPSLLLILAGDIYDSLNYRLNKEEEFLISYLQLLADKGRLLIVRGDHDEWLKSYTLESFNQQVYDAYLWRAGSKMHCVMHGHQCGDFCSENKQLSHKLLLLYKLFEVMGRAEVKVCGTKYLYKGIEWAKRVKGWWPSWSIKSAIGMIYYTRQWEVDIIEIGHLHTSVNVAYPYSVPGKKYKKKIRCVSTGGSPDLPIRYLMIKNNRVTTHKYLYRLKRHAIKVMFQKMWQLLVHD